MAVQHHSNHRYTRVPLLTVKSGVSNGRIVARDHSPTRQPVEILGHIPRWCHLSLMAAAA
jgi:hypothetical protein